MSETSDDGWTDWIPHDGGPCPIPWARDGEFMVRFADGAEAVSTIAAAGWDWRRFSNPAATIAAYRVRVDLAHRLAPAESAGADDGWRLEKRPTAFLVSVPSAGDYLFRCEAAASAFAEDRSVEYRGLYLREQPATTPARPIAEAAEEMARAPRESEMQITGEMVKAAADAAVAESRAMLREIGQERLRQMGLGLTDVGSINGYSVANYRITRAALTAALDAAPAPADAEVERVCAKLENIADASTRNDGSDIPLGELIREAARLLRTLSARLADVARDRDTARQYAHNLATWLYDKRYAATAPDWKPLPDLMGLLTQIDSMLASLPDDMAARDAATARAETAERERDEARAAVKRARSNALMVEHEQDAAHTSIVKRMNQAFRERDTATARAERAEAMLRECSETLRKIVKVGTREEFERFVGGYEKIVTVSEEAEIAAAIVSRLTAPAAPTEGCADE